MSTISTMLRNAGFLLAHFLITVAVMLIAACWFVVEAIAIGLLFAHSAWVEASTKKGNNNETGSKFRPSQEHRLGRNGKTVSH